MRSNRIRTISLATSGVALLQAPTAANSDATRSPLLSPRQPSSQERLRFDGGPDAPSRAGHEVDAQRTLRGQWGLWPRTAHHMIESMKHRALILTALLTNTGLQAQQVIVETFADNTQQAQTISGGTWSAGARPGRDCRFFRQ